MRVIEVIWLPEIEDKLWQKHHITVVEAEEGILSITGGDLSGFRGELAMEARLAGNLTGLYPEILRRY